MKQRIADQIVLMAEAYGISINEARIEIYAEMLADLPLDKIKRGIAHIIKTRTFAGNLPTVAEIREAIINDGETPDSRALFAWEKLQYAIDHHCPYDSVKFDDPIIHSIIQLWGGWTEMGNWPSEDTKWKRKEFLNLYQSYASSGNFKGPGDYLIGLNEWQNSQTGWTNFIPKPFLIGGKPGAVKSIPYKPDEPKRLQ